MLRSIADLNSEGNLQARRQVVFTKTDFNVASGSGGAVPGSSTERPLLPQLRASCCVAANQRAWATSGASVESCGLLRPTPVRRPPSLHSGAGVGS